MLNKIVRVFGGDPNKRQIDEYSETVDYINSLEPKYEAYSDEQLYGMTTEFRRRLALGETLDGLLLEAFAVVRETSKRTLGQRHYDVQLIGGISLHNGIIAEMRTGEGKTLVATLPLYLNALRLNEKWLNLAEKRWGADPNEWDFIPLENVPIGQGTHLVTVNDYLARRDARWMGVIYSALGLNVGVLQMAARTENGKKAFLIDFERESPHEDQHNLNMVSRREVYAADITYGTNNEFGFDYLRDNMTMRLEDRVQRGHVYSIIDEVDNVLIDEARTPLIISGPSHDDTEWYVRMGQVVKGLNSEDFELNERDRNITLTEIGETHVESLLNMPLRDPERPEDITPEQARLMGYLEQGLRAQYLFHRNKEYLVQAGKVVIVDEFTGRLMPGRRWSDGLHQAVEAKEGVKIQRENVTYATITIQNYFRMYEKLAGMTGTALTEAEEFDKIYSLEVLAIPTNLEYIASRPETDLIELQDRDEQGYKYTYYADKNDAESSALFWKRKDFPDVVYRSEEAKLRALTMEMMRFNTQGRPILVGTTSVELSDRISSRLKAEPIRRLATAIVIRSAWMEANQREEDGRAIQELEYLNQPLDQLPISEMRKMARSLDMSFNPQDSENLGRLISILGLSASDGIRLGSILQAGIPHQVLNARKHTEESQIIAGAGAFGAVTIATNMAGRGVDIKLGGEIAEEINSAISRILRRNNYADAYDMSLEEKHAAILSIDPEDYGIYQAEVDYFLKYIDDMAHVRDLGGLHVIGSERHESRRIDNQLRGRAGRQGDPGSSRFYLSMEDELMRLFGGQQAENMMIRMGIDDAMPLEVGLVSRLVEQSQSRVEGANFDVRKHLLEYDDVLNTQRAKIYDQRDLIFVKDDLSEDVTEMLQVEVMKRVPEALEDPEGPWRVLAWLDQIQPPLSVDGFVYPSYSLRLLVDHIMGLVSATESYQPVAGQHPQKLIDPDTVQGALIELAAESLQAEEEHVLRSVSNLMENSRQRFEDQLEERLETVDNFVDGLELADETDTRSPSEVTEELTSLVQVPLKLSSAEQRTLKEEPDEVVDLIHDQVNAALINQSVTRLIGAVERRLEEDLEVSESQLVAEDWDSLTDQILDTIQAGYERRQQRLIGDNGDGLIPSELKKLLAKVDSDLNQGQVLGLLIQMPQGSRAIFDKKTHRRVWRRTTRLSYLYRTARLLVYEDPEEVTAQVLDHLEGAQSALRFLWGTSEWSRVAEADPQDLDETTQKGLKTVLGEDRFAGIKGGPIQQLDGEERLAVADEFGRQALTEIYRQLLLGVISELWVEYLTSVEALRVSIGLEAYAQRDPLVVYKNRAFEMFRELLDNTRTGVVTRMFTYRPRDMSSVQTEVSSSAASPLPLTAPEPQMAEPSTQSGEKKKKKGKRRRRRRR
jgi:preprotein translocase subunit SecA